MKKMKPIYPGIIMESNLWRWLYKFFEKSAKSKH